VAIIDQGQVKAKGTRRELISIVGERDRVRLVADGRLDAAVDAARGLEGVETASSGEGDIQVVAVEATTLLPSLLAAVTATGVTVRGVEVEEPDLEAVFLHLTGKALRD
jgi:ABC-2 type transport system ATP-binding protein